MLLFELTEPAQRKSERVRIVDSEAGERILPLGRVYQAAAAVALYL